MKSLHSTANRHLRDYGERKKTQRRNEKDQGSTMMHASQLLQLAKKARLGMKRQGSVKRSVLWP